MDDLEFRLLRKPAADYVRAIEKLLRDCDARLREHGDTTMHPLRDRIYRTLGVPTVNK